MPASSDRFQFGPNFHTGITLIDDQHQVLFDLIDRVDEYLLGGRTDATRYSQTIEDLVNYAIYHLTFEEKLVARMGYKDELQAHALAHDEFRTKVNHFRAADQGVGPGSAAAKLQAYLKDWLVRHVLYGDLPLFRMIRQQSPETVR